MIIACSICLVYDYPGMPKSTYIINIFNFKFNFITFSRERELLAADFFFIIVFFVESLI